MYGCRRPQLLAVRRRRLTTTLAAMMSGGNYNVILLAFHSDDALRDVATVGSPAQNQVLVRDLWGQNALK